MLSGRYRTLYKRLIASIPKERLIHDELGTLAFGTDASFYRLIPQLVVKVEDESEVIKVLREASSLRLPVTFRAAGTSLSGQAISDSVLIVLTQGWTKYYINDNASTISLQPGVIGAYANTFLAPYGKKIGPDPASIDSAMIGGIAANNASGMCCGTAQNSYRTVKGMRIIFHDGTILDTTDSESRRQFCVTKKELVSRIIDLHDRIHTNPVLVERIRRKYKMKNTTGYSLNAFVDFSDPIDIIEHLIIGSEGTLGFIAEITYETVPELANKASSLIMFPDIQAACKAVTILTSCTVDAVEIIDRASLRSVQEKSGMPEFLRNLDTRATALLVETRATSPKKLSEQIKSIALALVSVPKIFPVIFYTNPSECTRLWNIRKGLFPSVGAMRATGTTCIIEDIAFPLTRLAEATIELQNLLHSHGYADAIIFGHAREGNLHFVFSQDFNQPDEVNRYARFIDDVTHLVVDKYDGSLKAEHGTGRNMAPFVELEWGSEAYSMMREIKTIFDPDNLLNPGVIINMDLSAHLKHLKPLPAANPIIDKCIECGFCEVQCPSKNLSITPRQRIAVYREMARLTQLNSDQKRLATLRRRYDYAGNKTCATDGLCALACPVGIDTGTLIKELRFRQNSWLAKNVATILARHMSVVLRIVRIILNTGYFIYGLFGASFMEIFSSITRKITGNKLPQWNRYVPKGGEEVKIEVKVKVEGERVVYFPSCINRAMGISRDYDDHDPITTKTIALLQKAGYAVVIPEGLPDLCCGMAFDSKGFREQGMMKTRELETALLKASNNGAYSILVDMSPCLFRMKETLDPKLQLFEPIEFIHTFLIDRLEFHRLNETVVIHTPCSAITMGLAEKFKLVAELCAEKVVVPSGIDCCGWAGDRGFTYPELNESALADLHRQIPESCTQGYSTSRTCEIGLSLHSGISYKSIIYLVDRCTTAKTTN